MKRRLAKQTMNQTLAGALIVQLGLGSAAQAQFDGDFAPPPPPPPPSFGNDFSGPGSTDFGAPISGGSSGISSNSGSPSDSTLSNQQKNRMATAKIEDITNENFPETIDSFDFPNADITDIVKAISELTGKNFIIDPGVRGKITIIAPTKITVAEAYKAFLSALAINGFAVVPSGKFYKIRSARNAQRDSIETFSGAYYPNSDQMITRIIHLKHISADAVNRDLRILASKDGEMVVYPQTNSIIISDYGANIDRVMKIIAQLDVQGFDDQLVVIPVKYARAKDISDLIDKIVNRGQNNQTNRTQGGFSAGVPRFSRNNTSGQQGSAYYMVIPDDRTNSLIVTGNKAGIDRIRTLLSQLDFRMRPEDSGGVYVYYVKNGEAEKIAQTLTGIAKETTRPSAGAGGAGGAAGAQVNLTASGAQATQEIFGGDVKITADKGTNSLVIVSSRQDYEVVLNLLAKLDIPRDQVYVESIIMEMRASDANTYDIGYFKFDASGAKSGFNGFGSGALTDLLNPQSGQGTILGFGSGSDVKITTPAGQSVTLKSLVGFINFLKSTANANILSTPSVIAMDNQEATIKSGDRVVVGFEATAGNAGPVARTPKFEDADIMLKLKPFISPTSDTVRMEIETSVKQISTARTPDAFKSETQPLAKREIKTNINVRDGDTVVMGGLQKEDEIEEVRKVPLLGDIPILGWLFKSRRVSTDKTNMLIFLTPKIMRSADDTRKLLTEKTDERIKFIKGLGGRDPYGAKVDQMKKSQALKRDNAVLEEPLEEIE
jgi:general secretion pathway protein D